MRVGDFVVRTFEPIVPDLRLSEVLERLAMEGFIPVLSEERFFGILSQADALCGSGDTVGDRLKPIPRFQSDAEISSVTDELLATGLPALPIFDTAGKYMGVITLKSMYMMVTRLAPSLISVKVVDVHGSTEFEAVKSAFLSNLYHQTKNPLQKIISTVSLLREEGNEKGRQFFCSVIEANAKQIDLTINNLAENAFRWNQPPC